MDLDLSNAQNAKLQHLSLDLLQMISDARNQHGIRSSDYQAYRQYCSSKVHRLRQLLSITHADANHQPKSKSSAANQKTSGKKTKGSKKAGSRQIAASQSAAEKGKGNQFTKKTLSLEKAENDRPAQLLLFEAERAWAHSQDLRNQSFEKDQDPRLRRIGLDRGTKSVNWSSCLLSLLKALDSRVDIITLTQATAYHLMILGNSNFDREHHQNALETLSLSRALLNLLSKCSKTSKDEALANSFIDSMEAMIRYCCYNLGKETNVIDLDHITQEFSTDTIGNKWLKDDAWTKLTNKLKAEDAETGGEKKKREKLEIDWNGKKIQIRNPELAEEIEKVRTQEEKLKESHQTTESKAAEGGNETAPVLSHKKGRTEKMKRERLTHAQRNEKKRGGATSASSKTNKIASTKSTTLNPFDSLLVTLTSASEVSSRLLSDHASALAKSHSGRYASAGNDLKDANEWILYKLFALRITRNQSLIAQVREKADRRDKRSKERMEKKIDSIRNGGSDRGTNVNRNKKKKVTPQIKEQRKNQPGSRAKRSATQTSKVHKRKPARSGSRSLQAHKASLRSQHLISSEKESSCRRSFRLVPSLSRLLDSTSISIDSIADLEICESNPDIASLVECKAHLNKSEVLKTLAKGYSLSSSTIPVDTPKAEIIKAKIRSCKISLLLLERAKLAVRQSKGSLDLIERDEIDVELDHDFPRQVLLDEDESQKFFDRELQDIEELRAVVMKSLWSASRDQKAGKSVGTSADVSTAKVAPSTSGNVGIGTDGLPNTKSAVMIRDLLSKNIQLDEREIEEASRIPVDRLKEFETESASSSSVKNKKGDAKKKQGETERVGLDTAVQAAGSSSDDEADFRDADDAGSPVGAGDDEDDEAEFNEADEFEEEEGEEHKEDVKKEADSGQRKGWLGGWFGR